MAFRKSGWSLQLLSAPCTVLLSASTVQACLGDAILALKTIRIKQSTRRRQQDSQEA